MAKTTACAMTKQLGSTMPSSPQILAAHMTDRAETPEGWMMMMMMSRSFSTAESSRRFYSPTMSFLICSVMGMGFTASGEMYLVKMVTASFSMPGKRQGAGQLKSRDFIMHSQEICVYMYIYVHIHIYVRTSTSRIVMGYDCSAFCLSAQDTFQKLSKEEVKMSVCFSLHE